MGPVTSRAAPPETRSRDRRLPRFAQFERIGMAVRLRTRALREIREDPSTVATQSVGVLHAVAQRSRPCGVRTARLLRRRCIASAGLGALGSG